MKNIFYIFLLSCPLTALCQFDNCYFIKLWRINQSNNENRDIVNNNLTALLSIERQYKVGTPSLYFSTARLYSKIYDSVKRMEYIKQGLLAGGEIDNIKYGYYLSEQEIKILTDWLEKNVLPLRNHEYIEFIDDIFGFDQDTRKNLKKDDPYFKEWLTRVDSFDAISFKNRIEKYGFPKIKEIGYNRYTKIFAIFLHIMPMDEQQIGQFFTDELKKAIFSGDFDPENFGAVIDRYQIRIKGGQQYGCYNMGYNTFTTILDIEHLDERRTSIGLAPLKEVLQYPPYANYLTPDDYKFNISNLCN